MNLSKIAAAAASILLLAAATASATTYVPVSDENLARQAAVVARVRVVQVDPGPANRAPATDYLVEVDELVQGYLSGSTVVVRVPGGVRADGLGFKIWGAPEFQPGDEALLFLDPGADGTYGILHLMLGAFYARRAGEVKAAVQDLSEAHNLNGDSGDESSVRDLDRFVNWLTDRAAGIERNQDYWIERPSGLSTGHSKAHTLLSTPDNVPARWFAFDSGKSVAWRMHSDGQPGLELTQTEDRFKAALDAWTSDPTSSIQYVYAGLTDASNGMGVSDKVNALLFNDPKGQVPGNYDCKTGGVIAFGGAYFYASTQDYRGQRFHDIFEGDVVVNNDTECLFKNNPSAAEEVFAHELGHTLGFGHATDAQALMWSKLHNDGRGARLGNDDRMGASMVYGDGSFQPAPAPAPEPGGDLSVTATPARTEIEVSWSSSLTGVTSFRVESKQKKSFRTLVTAPGDAASAMVGGLKPNQVLSLRVTALRADGTVAGSSDVVKVRTRK
jgi:hypothetical protein